MLKRLKFPDHDVDLCVETNHVLYVSLDRFTDTDGITVYGTVIGFRDSANPSVGSIGVRTKHQNDELKVRRLHTLILEELFKT